MSLTSRATAALADSLLQSNVPSAQPAGQGAVSSQSQTAACWLLTEHLHKPTEPGQDTGTGMFSFTNDMEKSNTHPAAVESLENHPTTLISPSRVGSNSPYSNKDKDIIVLKSQLYLAIKFSTNVIVAEC